MWWGDEFWVLGKNLLPRISVFGAIKYEKVSHESGRSIVALKVRSDSVLQAAKPYSTFHGELVVQR